jgi:hypothetical protein
VANQEPKCCVVCGREIAWRKRWARCWDEVRYCSKACRSRRLGARDRAIEAAILDLLRARGAGKTICPSEAARRVDPPNWRLLMEDARMAARRLVATGQAEIVQDGHAVDPSRARGPIRLRLSRDP